MKRRREKIKHGQLQLDPGYVACVERIGKLIPEWCAARADRPGLPDLKFFDHGNVMVGAALEPLTYCLLARTADATDLLEYLDEREPEATIFQVRCALGVLGFLHGAPTLSLSEIRAKMIGKAPMIEFARGEPPPWSTN